MTPSHTCYLDDRKRTQPIMGLQLRQARGELMARPLIVIFLVASLMGCGAPAPGASAHARDSRLQSISFSTTTGRYSVRFTASSGTITVIPPGSRAHLAIHELGTDKKSDLLYSVRSVRHSGTTFTLSGRSSWTSFTFVVATYTRMPGLLHLTLSIAPKHGPPTGGRIHPDVRLVGAPAHSLRLYDPAPPVAGTSLYLSNKPMDSSLLYLENLTSLGKYFDRTQSGAAEPNYSYPRAGGKGGLVGVDGAYFGYPPPISNLGSLPHSRFTRVIDSYLYLLPGVPATESDMADTYLKLLGSVYRMLPTPAMPHPDWHSLAAKAGSDLSDPSNLVTLGGKRFLVSYVSDTRKSPELITQAAVLMGIKAYEARYHEILPLEAVLEENLPVFYSPTFHTVKNGLGSDPAATEESWYYITNLISLLQLAQLGSVNARQLLLDSIDGAISLAHTNKYEFPQNFDFADWNGHQSGLQPDVAGGYAWLMLGMYDLTKEGRFLDEAKASIAHVGGKGFGLAYETHMLAYTAAAAQRLYTITRDPADRGYAELALSNLFHVTRLWDCTYGNCRKGAGYHTYFGINPLPWSDYIAPFEQYEAWLGLRDYMKYASGEPSYITDLVGAFLAETPLTMQYTLPTRLPSGVAVGSPGEYAFVTKNNLSWDIPLEDLRVGEQNSGIIGQEIYGAGAPFVLAAYGP